MATRKDASNTPARTVERRTAPRKTTTGVSKSNDTGNAGRVGISPDEIKRLIAEAAYFRAKERGFKPGHELEDWVQAEAEIARRLDSRR